MFQGEANKHHGLVSHIGIGAPISVGRPGAWLSWKWAGPAVERNADVQ
jgi:hypothetical protein